MAAQDAGFNTRVEELAEAIENLCIGVTGVKGNSDNKALMLFLNDARKEVREKLRGFMIPSLRLIEPRQPYGPEVPVDDRVTCAFCKKDHMCSQPNCSQWHKSVRAKVAQEASGDEPPDQAA